MNTREKVLKEALNCVNGEREKQYGNPEDNFQRIADFWGLYLTTLFEGTNVVVELDPKDVAVMMILFKIARSLGDEDKLDNYVDIIGYAACGAEIFEKDESEDDDELMLEKIAQDPYSYYHDELAKYVSIKAKEKHISLEVDDLKKINRKFPRELEELLDHEAKDCAINGKKLFDCYRKIDELFDKYDIPDKVDVNDFLPKGKPYAYWDSYGKIATYINRISKEANISQFDVVDCLVRNGHAPTEIAGLLMAGKLSFDDAASIISNAVDELRGKHKTFEEVAENCWHKIED